MGRARWWVLLAAALCFSQHRRADIGVALGQQEDAVNHHELHDLHERWKLLTVFAGGTLRTKKRFFLGGEGGFPKSLCWVLPRSNGYFTSHLETHHRPIPRIHQQFTSCSEWRYDSAHFKGCCGGTGGRKSIWRDLWGGMWRGKYGVWRSDERVTWWGWSLCLLYPSIIKMSRWRFDGITDELHIVIRIHGTGICNLHLPKRISEIHVR